MKCVRQMKINRVFMLVIYAITALSSLAFGVFDTTGEKVIPNNIYTILGFILCVLISILFLSAFNYRFEVERCILFMVFPLTIAMLGFNAYELAESINLEHIELCATSLIIITTLSYRFFSINHFLNNEYCIEEIEKHTRADY